MPKYGPHLAGIEKKVHARLAELGFTPRYIFDARKHQERFYTAPCRDAAGREVVFKMRTEDFAETRIYFRREIEINRLFARHAGPEEKMSVPRFLDGDSRHAPEWMVYAFIAGQEAGDFYNGLTLSRRERFPLPALLDAFGQMHRMSAFAPGEATLKRETGADYLRAFAGHAFCLEPFFAPGEIAAAREILAAGVPRLDAAPAVITHGDFHPGNLLLTPAGGVAILDWYNVMLNNLAFDPAFFILELTEPKLRTRLLEAFAGQMAPARAEFEELFRLDVLRLAPQKINVLYDALYTEHPTAADYRAKLTAAGRRKLQLQLEFFRRALRGESFL